MRIISKRLVPLLVWALASPALAGITVTSYQTVALTNAYAPVGGTQYIDQQVVANVSPAVAKASGDWMGTNAGGSTVTWHYVGMARANSTTAADANILGIAAAGSFSYEITTTAEFIDPRSSSIYTPAAAANYEAFFNTNITTTYAISVELRQWSKVFFGSTEVGFIFNEINHSPTPRLIQLSGTIPAGHYQIGASAGLGAPNLPNGVNHFLASGSFEDLRFTVEVPEPNTLAIAVTMIAQATRRRKRCASAV
jgi:hypothetical protein